MDKQWLPKVSDSVFSGANRSRKCLVTICWWCWKVFIVKLSIRLAPHPSGPRVCIDVKFVMVVSCRMNDLANWKPVIPVKKWNFKWSVCKRKKQKLFRTKNICNVTIWFDYPACTIQNLWTCELGVFRAISKEICFFFYSVYPHWVELKLDVWKKQQQLIFELQKGSR